MKLLFIPFFIIYLTYIKADNEQQIRFVTTSTSIPGKRVAIIGAGPGGSSAAYFLRQLHPNFSSLNITIFESTGRIGGRVISEEILGKTVELGASIFVSANRYMVNFAKTFGLSMKEPFTTPNQDKLGIWDGQDLVYLDGENSIVNKAKFIWKYGWSYLKARSATLGLLEKWNKIYDEQTTNSRGWRSIDEIYRKMGLSELLAKSGYEWMKSVGASDSFTHQLLGSITRVNYAQDTQDINAWGAAVCLIAMIDDAFSIKNGNFMVFNHLVKASKSAVSFNSPVTKVSKSQSSPFYSVQTKNGAISEFDAVIIATPMGFSGIQLDINSKKFDFNVEYVHLDVTIVVSIGLRGSFFGLKDNEMPTSLLTTDRTSSPFICYSIVDTIPETNQIIIKLFSYELLTDDLLDQLLYEKSEIRRQTFRAYPKLPTQSLFPHIILDDGLFYVNAFKTSISTMETEIIAGKNAATLTAEYIA